MCRCSCVTLRRCMACASFCTAALAWAGISVLSRSPVDILRQEEVAPQQLAPRSAAQPLGPAELPRSPVDILRQEEVAPQQLAPRSAAQPLGPAARQQAAPQKLRTRSEDAPPSFADVLASLDGQPQQPPVEDSLSENNRTNQRPLLVHMTAATPLDLENGTDNFSALWRRNLAFLPANASIEFYNDTRMRSTARVLSALVWRAGLTERAQHAYEAYRRLRPPAFRADLWRYMLLWAKGGVYFDAKVRLVQPLGAIFNLSSAALQVSRDRVFGAYWQGAYAAITPRNEGLAKAVRQVVSDVRAHRFFPSPIRLTGPMALFAAVGPRDCKAPPKLWGPWTCNEEGSVSIIGTMRFLPKADANAPGLCKGDTFNGDCQLLLQVDQDVHRHQHTDYDSMAKKRQVYCDDPGPLGCDTAGY